MAISREHPDSGPMVPPQLAGDFDWKEVWKYASPANVARDPNVPFSDEELVASALMGIDDPKVVRDHGPADVAAVIALEEGENDGPDWLAVVRLTKGAFLYVHAGCDYTGWG
jgi:hypothetical protein